MRGVWPLSFLHGCVPVSDFTLTYNLRLRMEQRNKHPSEKADSQPESVAVKPPQDGPQSIARTTLRRAPEELGSPGLGNLPLSLTGSFLARRSESAQNRLRSSQSLSSWKQSFSHKRINQHILLCPINNIGSFNCHPQNNGEKLGRQINGSHRWHWLGRLHYRSVHRPWKV